MEQYNGAPGSALSQAARTILPGEPFDPPMPTQVPGPRPPEEMQAPAPVPQWNYEPAQPAYGPPTQFAEPMPAQMPTQMPTYPMPPADLHEYASLPTAQPYPAPSPESAWPPAALPQSEFGGVYPPPAPLPPLPPPPFDDDRATDGGHRRGDRKRLDKRLLALAAVVVIAGGGYFGYTQLSKSDSSSAASPTVVAPVAAPKYGFPANLAGFNLQRTPAATQLRSGVLALVKTYSPAAVKTASFASYSPGQPMIYAMTFHPGTAKVAGDFKSFTAFVAKPDKGNVAVASQKAVPGAAGGVMQCGGQRGSATESWCTWHNNTTIGVMIVQGSPKTELTQILTRELRAYAEH